MRFLKKNFKLIVGILIGAILISGISVYATSQYLASQVSYTKPGETQAISVEAALNELYTNSKQGNLVQLDVDQTTNSYTFTKNYKTIYMAVFRGPDVPVIKINNVEQNYTIRREHSGYYTYIYKIDNINKDDVLYHIGYADVFTIDI